MPKQTKLIQTGRPTLAAIDLPQSETLLLSTDVPPTVILQGALCVRIMTDAGTGNRDADAPLKFLF